MLQEYKDVVPYIGNEKLTFVHVNTGDTEIFIGEPTWTTYYNSSFGGADCTITKKREGRGIAFKSQSSNKTITFNQYMTEQSNNLVEINFEDLIVETRLLDSPYEKIHDSIIIQNKKYYKIYFYSNDLSGKKPTDYGCYYTRTDGIIKLFFKTGEYWELINKQ
ncbi:MAG: hypothetical protein H7296_08815 [Bacteroidia bacterium]|nr:hypothetical protein [Bacteroidia bacterium]